MNSDKKFTTGVIVVSSLIAVGIVVVVLRNRAKARKAEQERQQAEKDNNKGTTQQTTTTSTPEMIKYVNRNVYVPTFERTFQNIASAQKKGTQTNISEGDKVNLALLNLGMAVGTPR